MRITGGIPWAAYRNYLLDFGSGFLQESAMAQKKEQPTPAPEPQPPPSKTC
jgi:hypothetical protein